MNLVLIHNSRIPTEKAHGYQIAKMSESFATAGADVTLIVPFPTNADDNNIFDYYTLKENFKVEYVQAAKIAYVSWLPKTIVFYINSLLFLRTLSKKNIPKDAFIYSRQPDIISAYAKRGYKAVYDAHTVPKRFMRQFKRMLALAHRIVCNSAHTAEAYRALGFTNVGTFPNAVDLSDFAITEPKESLRKKYNLPLTKKITMYVGHLYTWKGIDTVVEAASQNTNQDIVFVCVGGTPDDVKKYQEKTKSQANILFTGHKEKAAIAGYMKAADVLLLPNVPISDESTLYTSPIKMFEYMATGVPIVASDLPSIREILNDNNAILVESAKPKALINGVVEALNNGREKAQQALIDVQKNTWQKRAQAIIKFL